MMVTDEMRQAPVHHVDETMLMAYATGSLPEAESLLVATHLALCPACRAAVETYEALGGDLIEDIEAEAVSPGALEAVLSRLDAGPAGRIERPVQDGGDPTVPQPLRGYLGQKLDALPWRPVIRGLQEHDLGISGARVKMLRIEAGAGMPQHSHEGTEHTLVLTGSYGDTLGIYRRGDVSTTDASVDHRPLAGTDGPCICLTVVDAPLRLTGPLGRFLNPFVRF